MRNYLYLQPDGVVRFDPGRQRFFAVTRLSYDPKASYLILSLAEETPVLKSFGVSGGEVTPQTLEIV